MPEHLFVRFGERHSDFPNDSVMLERIRAFDWSGSSVGPIETWPDEIRSAVRMTLLSESAMAVLIGSDGIMVHNDALHRLLGDHYAGVLGLPVAEALPIAAGFFRDALAACGEGKGVRHQDHPLKLLRNGLLETAWFSVSLTPIADIAARVYGAFVVVSETTERMRALKALGQSRQRMELALDAGGIVGTWDLDIRTNTVFTNGAFAELFGVSGGEARRGISKDVLAAALHPDDRERVLGGLSSAIRTGSDYRCDYRAVTRDGETRWFVLTGRPRRDETGAIVQYAGIVIDVTERTEAAAALEQSNLRFDILAESIPQIVWSTDAEGRHDSFNRRWNEFTGIAPDRIEPTTWQELVHPEDWPRVQQAWQNCLTTGETYDIDYRFRHRDGGYRWLWVLALPLRDAEGRIIRWYGTSSDIDAPKQLDQERELVAHELDHRIKNLFALVNGLVSLSLRELPEHRPLADTLRARLEALNRAHGLIRGERDARCGSLRLLIEQLLAPYRDGYAGRIAIAGEDVTIDAGAVTAVALVFHELITNAAKYGALSRADGSLGITLGADDTLQTIDWQERFEGGIAGEVGEGFGSRLLKAMIEGQLRGTMTSRPSPRGLWLRIDLPRTAFGLTARG